MQSKILFILHKSMLTHEHSEVELLLHGDALVVGEQPGRLAAQVQVVGGHERCEDIVSIHHKRLISLI